MKSLLTNKATALFIALSTATIFAADPPHSSPGHDHSKHHGATKAATAAKGAPQRHLATGKVNAIDRKAGEIEINHGPIPGLDMPGMTMGFPVKDRALLDKIKPGQDAEFVLMERGTNEHVIADIKPK
jgi:Cu/Ag efflux protein CusF